ncbi:hypothetical protein HMPREF9141_1652 [Prevotella multiformis DSM 16608]|uniref:Uncharacterized protein n=1 Tax=Prevotella multiformis DSM 16608 TaxID=888743 RepID=F0F7T5_9BACT|nr:hypothetical protein HMPREF9141_1652 [Prevotella multiformis DSM 16608]
MQYLIHQDGMGRLSDGTWWDGPAEFFFYRMSCPLTRFFFLTYQEIPHEDTRDGQFERGKSAMWNLDANLIICLR